MINKIAMMIGLKILKKVNKKYLISSIVIVLLIISNIILFKLYSKSKVQIGYLQSQIKALQTSLVESYNECQSKINNLNDIATKTKNDYEYQLQLCYKSKKEIKEVIRYKVKKVPVERIKVVKELEPCNIYIVDYSNEGKEDEEINVIKYYLEHIGF